MMWYRQISTLNRLGSVSVNLSLVSHEMVKETGQIVRLLT